MFAGCSAHPLRRPQPTPFLNPELDAPQGRQEHNTRLDLSCITARRVACMGLSIDSANFLAKARQSGVRFTETLTLGRQHMLLKSDHMESVLKAGGAWPPSQGEAAFRQAVSAEFPWGFPTFARALGAEKVLSMDASAYEGADLVHDLNQPVPAEWEERFDVVIDGGTLEHVFNFPAAIANCMKLVKTGGHLILFTPANNYFGHGFYQFSPELFYRVLTPENGFAVESMIALADNVGIGSIFGFRYYFPITGPWYAVPDPEQIRRRVTLINHESVILMVLARKTARRDVLKSTPQQSDYTPRWEKGKGDSATPRPQDRERTLAWLGRWIAGSYYSSLGRRLTWLINPLRLKKFRRKNSFHNRALFKRVQD